MTASHYVVGAIGIVIGINIGFLLGAMWKGLFP